MKRNKLFLAMALIIGLLPNFSISRAIASPDYRLASENRTVGATINPNQFTVYDNWDNTNPEITITWNDATSVTGMSFYEGDDVWKPLPNEMWSVVNDNGTTATLIIDLDQSPAKGIKDGGEQIMAIYTWRVEFDFGEPAIGQSNYTLKTFYVTFDVKDELGNPIPSPYIHLEPYYGNGNPGNFLNFSNYPTVEIAARRDYSYIVQAGGYSPVTGTILSIEENITLSITLNEIGQTYTVSYGVIGDNGWLNAHYDGFYFGSGTQIEEGKDIVFNAQPWGGYTVKEWRVNNQVVVGNTGLTYVHENLQGNIHVTVEFKNYEFPSISPQMQYFSLQEPTDMVFEIQWGSETEITNISAWLYDDEQDESYEVFLTQGVDYLIAGSSLTISAGFLNSLNLDPYNWVSFNVNFGLGGFGWFGIVTIPTSLPQIFPEELAYDLSNPGDLLATIVYNLASEVTSVSVGGVPLVQGADYQINGSWFFLLNSYLALALPEVGDEIMVGFVFDTGANLQLTVTAVQTGVVNAIIDPDFISFNEDEFPEYVDIEITWNDASAVTGMDVLVAFQWGVQQFPWEAYQLTDHGDGTATLRILFDDVGDKTGAFEKAGAKAEEYTFVSVNIHFNVGASAIFRMLIIEEYYYVNVTIEPDGAGWVSGDHDYNPGDEVYLSAGPFWQYQFLHWEDTQGNVVSTDNPWIFYMPSEDLNLVARFAKSHYVQFGVYGMGGELSATADDQPISSGDMIVETAVLEFTANPDPGNVVKEWKINGDIVMGNSTNTLIIDGFASNLHVTVEFQGAPYEFPAISPEEQFFSLEEPADIEFNIEWGSETEIISVTIWQYDEVEDEYYQMPLALGTDYLVDGSTLIVTADFILSLNPDPYDWLSFNIQFGIMGYGWFNIIVIPSTQPTLNPSALEYDLDNPADLMTTIGFSLAQEVIAVLASGVALIEGTDYHLNGSWLFIHNSYLGSVLQQVNDEIVLMVLFDTEAEVPLTITAIESGVINASISPASISFYEHEFPEYTDITITWNDASEVTGLTVLVSYGFETEEFDYPFYEVTDNGDGTANLRIFFMDDNDKAAFVKKLSKAQEYIYVTIKIHFDVGASANFLMTIIYEYYYVNISVMPENAGWVDGGWDYSPGQEVELQAHPNWGFEFSHWEDAQGNLVSTNNPYNFVMPSNDVNLVAIFEQFFMVNWSITGSMNGTLTASVDTEPINDGDMVLGGTTVVFTATPNPEYMVMEWGINGQVVPLNQTNTLEVTLTDNVYVNVAFQPIPFGTHQVHYSVVGGVGGTLSASANGNPVANGGFVNEGSNVVFTANPSSGYQVKEWKINGTVYEVSGEPYTQNSMVITGLEDDINVTVEFGLIPALSYTVSFSVENEDGAPITDAVVTFNDITNAAGDYIFAAVTPGTYAYSVSRQGYLDAAGNVNIVDIDVSVTVVMVLETFMVTFEVEDEDETPIADATITLNGETNPAGNYVFAGLLPGTYSYAVVKEGYLDAAGQVTVVDADLNVTVVLETVPVETFAVTFNVNMTYAESFDPSSDVVYITGNILGWAEPGTDPENQTMSRVGESMIWTKTHELEAGTYAYKYFLNAGWGGGEWQGGDDRSITVNADMEVNDWFGSLTDPTNLTYTNLDQIRVYPVPASNSLYITSPEEIRHLRIIDIVGQVVYSSNVAGLRHQVNVGGFKNGIYFVQILTSKGIETRRIQVQK